MASAPASLMPLLSSLRDGKQHKKQRQLKTMPSARVAAQAVSTTSFTTTASMCTSTRHRPAIASSLHVLNKTPSHSKHARGEELGMVGCSGKALSETSRICVAVDRQAQLFSILAKHQRHRRTHCSTRCLHAQGPHARRAASTPCKAHPSRWRERRGGNRCDGATHGQSISTVPNWVARGLHRTQMTLMMHG
jgi:hypothetical protein